MAIIKNKQTKTKTYGITTQDEAQSLIALHNEIQRKAQRRAQAEAANDTISFDDVLFNELQGRYGPGFAQWVVDRVNDAVSSDT
jgi:hypothetical protein